MGWLDTGPPKAQYEPSLLYKIFRAIEEAINYMDERNFKNGISGSVIKSGTLPANANAKRSVPLSNLNWREWTIPLILQAEIFSTKNTDELNIGGYFQWNPLNFPGGDWYLEASIVNQSENGITTCSIKGSETYGEVSANDTSLVLKRSEKLMLPSDKSETLWLTIKTSNSSYSAGIVNARLIFVPV